MEEIISSVVASFAFGACWQPTPPGAADAGPPAADASPLPSPVGCVTDVSAGHHLFACDGGIRYDLEIPDACRTRPGSRRAGIRRPTRRWCSRAPSREVPILQVHGHEDAILDFALFAIPQRDAALRYWKDDAGTVVEMDGTHTVTRYVSPSGTPLELWEHDYAAGSFVLGGHCFPGGTDIGPSPLQFGCADQDTFVVGERVMQFFLDHPMP